MNISFVPYLSTNITSSEYTKSKLENFFKEYRLHNPSIRNVILSDSELSSLLFKVILTFFYDNIPKNFESHYLIEWIYEDDYKKYFNYLDSDLIDSLNIVKANAEAQHLRCFERKYFNENQPLQNILSKSVARFKEVKIDYKKCNGQHITLSILLEDRSDNDQILELKYPYSILSFNADFLAAEIKTEIESRKQS